MPNWVQNWLTVRTQDKHFIIGKDECVDFNTLIPMPKELENTISGGSIDDCMAYQYLKTHTKDEFVKSRYFIHNYAGLKESMTKKAMAEKLLERIGDNPKMFDSEFFDKGEHNHTPEEIGQYYLDLVEKFGYYDWYNWHIANWGCKWNACRAEIVSEEGGITCFQFDTPWCRPIEWLDVLSEKIPFHLAWEEEQGYRGIVTSFGNGIETDEDLPMLELEEDDDGNYTWAEDEYGTEWTSLYLDDIFKKGVIYATTRLEARA